MCHQRKGMVVKRLFRRNQIYIVLGSEKTFDKATSTTLVSVTVYSGGQTRGGARGIDLP